MSWRSVVLKAALPWISWLVVGLPSGLSAQAEPRVAPRGGPAVAPDTLLHVPPSATHDSPVPYPHELAEGERLLIEARGGIQGPGPDSSGVIPAGALVARFDGGPPFLVMGPTRSGEDDRRQAARLLWAAPTSGRLGFAVAPGPSRGLTGGYSVGLIPLGRRGDPRQARFPIPWIAFVPRSHGGDFLEVTYGDRSGLGLDRKTLQVILDTERGERVVLSPYFRVDSEGAVLEALPPEVDLPPGVHKVTATIGDALGNVSAPAEIFLDQP